MERILKIYNIVLEENIIDNQQLTQYGVQNVMLNNSILDIYIDYEFLEKRYGFSISLDEIKLFHTHNYIWNDFISSEASICLVIENVKEIKSSYEEILEKLTELPNEWDIFFPYDGNISNDKKCKGHYQLGHRWGSDAYFLSKKGADILKNITVIKQPVDEEILALAMDERLNIYFENTYFFEYGTDERYFINRQQSIKKAIYNIRAWNISDKKKIKSLVKKISDIATGLGVELILCDGSLLGKIRHGGIMPWDNDVDLTINVNNIESLLSSLDKEKSIRYAQMFWKGFLYYKIWGINGQSIAGYEHLFPFVDLWLIKQQDNKMEFNHGITYMANDFYPLQKTIFEGAELFMPKNPMACLDATFQTWRSHLIVYPWCHKQEKYFFPNLMIEIDVDDNGRIV